jgi:hypothetical protein
MIPVTLPELEEMLKHAMEEVRRESGGEFDKYTEAFFSAGFRMGINAILTREVLHNLPPLPKRKEN